MKKIFFTLIAVFSLSATALSAKDQWAMGGAIGSPTLVFNLLVPAGPISFDLDLGWSFWSLDTGSTFFAALDILLWEPQIVDQLRFLIGVGPRLGFWAYGCNQWCSSGSGGFYIGPRVPIGVDWQPINHLSLVFKIAPGVSFGVGSRNYVAFSFDFGFGARYVF